jgi:hypothetical protein
MVRIRSDRCSGVRGHSPAHSAALGGAGVLVIALVLTSCGGGSASTASKSTAATHSTATTKPGAPPPAAAEQVASQLASPNATVAHSVLAPAAGALVSGGPLFPSGSTLTLAPDSWHQNGRFANATANVRDNSKTSTYEIGFLDTPAGWRVTFATPTS